MNRAASCAAPLSAVQAVRERNRDVNDPGSGASAAPRPVKGSFTSRFRVSLSLPKVGRHLPANVDHRAAHPSARVVVTIWDSSAPCIASAIRRHEIRVSVLRAAIGRCHSRCMSRRDREAMNETEVHALFDRLFPYGFAGQDVLDEIAPDGWEHSPLWRASIRPSSRCSRND